MERRTPEPLRPQEVEREQFRLSSGTEGKIDEITIASNISQHGRGYDLSPGREGIYFDESGELKTGKQAQNDLNSIKGLLMSLPEGVKLRIIIEQEFDANARRVLDEWLVSLRATGLDPGKVEVEIVETPEKANANIWVRDYMLISDDGHSVLIPRVGSHNPGRVEFVKGVTKKIGLETVDAPFYFEGGDLRFDNQRLYVGASILAHDIVIDQRTGVAGWPKIDMPNLEEKVDKLGAFFGTEAVLVGKEYLERELGVGGDLFNLTDREKDHLYLRLTPYHLDLYFTPLGHNQVAVGDVNLFLSILETKGGGAGERFLASLRESFNKIGEQQGGYSTTWANTSARRYGSGVANILSRMEDYKYSKCVRQTQQYLDSVSEQMKTLGLEVIRLPLMPAFLDKDELVTALITYNNSLVENYKENGEEVRRIWLPRFGPNRGGRKNSAGRMVDTSALDMVDAEVRLILRQAGLQTIDIESGFGLTTSGGSINCAMVERRKKTI